MSWLLRPTRICHAAAAAAPSCGASSSSCRHFLGFQGLEFDCRPILRREQQFLQTTQPSGRHTSLAPAHLNTCCRAASTEVGVQGKQLTASITWVV